MDMATLTTQSKAWARGAYTVLTTYYTNWTLVAWALLSAGYLHPCLTTSVHMMLMTSSVGGLYVTYIYPRKIILRKTFPVGIVIRGWLLKVVDLVAHHIPLWVSVAQGHHQHQQSKFPFLLVLAIYLVGHDPRVQYSMDNQDVVAIFAVVALCYMFC